jgi:hypothetical protein
MQVLAAASSLLLVSACGATLTYRPPDSGTPHAIVASSSRLTLSEVDGKTTRHQARITPGDHLVTMSYAAGPFGGINPCHVAIKAEAGRRYRAQVDDRNLAALDCWLLDEETGEKFEGYFGSLEPTMRGAE